MSSMSDVLSRLTTWALGKNPGGGYTGENDKRWAYTIESEGTKYLTRVLSPSLFGCRVYLHQFHRPDEDRFCHSHPWSWGASFILSGEYDEERVTDIVNVGRAPAADGGHWIGMKVLTAMKRVRWFNFLAQHDYHRVVKLHGDVWTLFITGPSTGESWGFLVDGEHVDWKTYLGKKIGLRIGIQPRVHAGDWIGNLSADWNSAEIQQHAVWSKHFKGDKA